MVISTVPGPDPRRVDQARGHQRRLLRGVAAGEEGEHHDLEHPRATGNVAGHADGIEVLLGGASRTVLESMTLPVLMAH